MNLQDCKVGDVVMTGDLYGLDLCVCITPSHYNKDFGFNVVTFLCLTNGNIHDSGSSNSTYEDDCNYVTNISQEEVDVIIEKWKID